MSLDSSSPSPQNMPEDEQISKNSTHFKAPEYICPESNFALKESTGASLVEYVLLVALIALVVVVSLKTIGTKLSVKYSDIASSV